MVSASDGSGKKTSKIVAATVGRSPQERTRRKVSRRDAAVVFLLIAIVLVAASNWYLAHTHHAGSHHLQTSALFDALQASLGGQTILQSTTSGNTSDQTDAYLLSSICGGCTRSNQGRKKACFDLVLAEKDKLGWNATLLEAAINVGKQYKECRVCDPAKCLSYYHDVYEEEEKYNQHRAKFKYWRFDRSAPQFSNPTTFYLNSIPSEFRIPPSRFHDIGLYFQEMRNYTLDKQLTGMPYLLEYNPGLVAIPPLEKAKLPKEAYYLMSLRVTPANNCFETKVYSDLPKDVWEAVYHTGSNHLGLTLLDEHYQIIDGYEIVLEMDTQLDLRRKTNVGSALSPTFMDYRLFVFNGGIYLHANADTVVVTQLNLSTEGRGDHEGIMYCESIYENHNSEGFFKTSLPQEEMDKPCKMKSLYGGEKLKVAINSQFRTIWSGGAYGKNYALFSIPNVTHPDAPDSVYAEIDLFPHHVHQIVPNEHNVISRRQVFERIWKPGTKKRRNYPIDVANERVMKTVGNVTENRLEIPLPSFFNVDSHENWFPGSKAPFKEAAHGGACCVSFSRHELNLGGTRSNHNDGESLLVGIGHTKVTWKPWYSKGRVPQMEKDRLPHTHYVSLFYAFDPHPPFEVRARSGYFCLGHVPMTGNEADSEGGRFNPYSVLTRNRNLSQNFVTFDCPQMHFVSSFIEKAGDSSKTIIGYGLNDCTGRLVEVDKKDVVRLLYPEPTEMVFDGSDEN